VAASVVNIQVIIDRFIDPTSLRWAINNKIIILAPCQVDPHG